MYYLYSQNNSGGSFVENERVSKYVVIEASSYVEANNKAEEIGIYFHGVSHRIDCECCGDRWSECYDDDEGVNIISDLWCKGRVYLYAIGQTKPTVIHL